MEYLPPSHPIHVILNIFFHYPSSAHVHVFKPLKLIYPSDIQYSLPMLSILVNLKEKHNFFCLSLPVLAHLVVSTAISKSFIKAYLLPSCKTFLSCLQLSFCHKSSLTVVFIHSTLPALFSSFVFCPLFLDD